MRLALMVQMALPLSHMCCYDTVGRLTFSCVPSSTAETCRRVCENGRPLWSQASHAAAARNATRLFSGPHSSRVIHSRFRKTPMCKWFTFCRSGASFAAISTIYTSTHPCSVLARSWLSLSTHGKSCIQLAIAALCTKSDGPSRNCDDKKLSSPSIWTHDLYVDLYISSSLFLVYHNSRGDLRSLYSSSPLPVPCGLQLRKASTACSYSRDRDGCMLGS